MYTVPRSPMLTWDNVLSSAENLNRIYKNLQEASRSKDKDKIVSYIDNNEDLFHVLETKTSTHLGFFHLFDINGNKERVGLTERFSCLLSEDFPIHLWIMANCPDGDQHKWIKSKDSFDEWFDTLLGFNELGQDKLIRAFYGLVQDFSKILSFISKVLSTVYPVKSSYLGFTILNEDRLSSYVVNQMLEGVEAFVAIFKKRHLYPVLKYGLKAIDIRYAERLDRKAIAYYSQVKKEITLLHSVLNEDVMTRQKYIEIEEVLLHEFGHYIHLSYLSPDAKRFWDAPWDEIVDEEDERLKELGIPTNYGHKNVKEDFAETFYWFVKKPEKLSPQARYRMMRTLSLSGLYGKPVMQLAKKLALKGHADLAIQILEVYARKFTIPSPISPKEAAKEAIADYFLSPDGLIYPLDYGSHEDMSQALRWKFYPRDMEAGRLYTIEEKNWVSVHDYVFDVTFMRDKKLTQKQQDVLFDIFLEARKEYKENKNLPSYKRHNLLEMIKSLVSPEAKKLGLHLDKAYKKFEKETKIAMSSASRKDIEDAIDHLEGVLDIRNKVLSIDLFDIKHVPNFDYSQTEDDFDSWAEWAEGELEDLDEEELTDELISFRGRSFAQQALKWMRTDKWPPIVVIDTDVFYEICDGRGRTSVAIGIGKKTLPATILTLKKGLSLKAISNILDDIESDRTTPAWPITPSGIKESERFLKGKPYIQGILPLEDLNHMQLQRKNQECGRHPNGCLPHIMGLVQEIKKKKPLPPIVVYKEGAYYVVFDGNHRVAAAILAGKKNIPALIQL